MDQATEEEVQREKRAARLQRYAVAAIIAVVLLLWSYDIWFPTTNPKP
jgi:predicted nucleic acid-binding Zn ribbon protein